MQRGRSPRQPGLPSALQGGADLRLTRRLRSRHDARDGSLRGSKGNAVRDPGSNAAAAPATVSGEPRVNYATGKPGRRGQAGTREPGDLPSVVVTREHIGRGA